MMYIAYADSPVGALTLASADDTVLSKLWVDGQGYGYALLREETVWECEADSLTIFREAARWLKLHFSGQEPNFYPRLSFNGSEFRKETAREMFSVPYGRAASYKQLAKSLATWQGRSYVSPHATGGVVAHNPLLILIPCHHIIDADGRLTGYAGGLEWKKYLLTLEAGQS